MFELRIAFLLATSLSIPLAAFGEPGVPQICRLHINLKVTTPEQMIETWDLGQCFGVLASLTEQTASKQLLTAGHCSVAEIQRRFENNSSNIRSETKLAWEERFRTGKWQYKVECISNGDVLQVTTDASAFEVPDEYGDQLAWFIAKMMKIPTALQFPIDLGVLHFEKPIAIAPLQISTKDPSEFSGVDHACYVTKQAESNSKKVNLIQERETVLQKDVPLFATGQQLVPGDSGGPLFCEQQTKLTIWGINSFFIPGGRGFFIQAFSPAAINWLKKVIN